VAAAAVLPLKTARNRFFDRMNRMGRMFWKMFPEVNLVNPDILSKKWFLGMCIRVFDLRDYGMLGG
jgi:hypothetical protein